MDNELKNILLKVVSNTSLITDDVISEAINDTNQIVKNKDLETPFFLDIAVYRFFTRVNAKAPESIKEAYEKALQRLKTTPTKTKNIKVENRASLWI